MSDGYYESSDDMFDPRFDSRMGGGIFDQLFGRGGTTRSRNSRKSETTLLPFKLSLEDCFKGKKTRLLIKKKEICSTCHGCGSKSGSNRTCSQCRGKGIVTKVQHLGPRMMTQTQGVCDDCRGQGEIIENSDRCAECNGNKVVSATKTVEVTFPRGSGEGTNITLKGEGDQTPGLEPGDIVIKVELKPHDTFKCVSGNLHMVKTVTMTEALCGLKFPVKRLDESIFLVQVNNLIKKDDVRVVHKEGMPSSDRQRGNMYITFSIEYPSNDYASISDISLLKSLLVPTVDNNNNVDPEAVYVEMDDFVEPTRFTGGSMSDDDDRDDERRQFHGHQQSAQCASQ